MTKYENKELKGTTLVIEDCFFINCFCASAICFTPAETPSS